MLFLALAMSASLQAAATGGVVQPGLGVTEPNPPKPFNDMFGAWSPDGSRIAFTSDRSGDPEIYIAGADGSRLRQLTHVPGRDAHPSWSPDGHALLFQSPRESGHVRIFRMNADGSNQRSLSPTTGFCGVPSWSPMDASIVFQCSSATKDFGSDKAPWRIFRLAANSSRPAAVTTGPRNDQVPSWAPDGKRLLFFSDRTGTNQVYEIDLAKRSTRQLTFGPAAHSSASYSPDGKRIALMRAEAGGKADAYVLTESRRLIRITDSGPEFGTPQFSPDGQSLLLQLPTPNGWRLFLAPADGRRSPRRLDFRP